MKTIYIYIILTVLITSCTIPMRLLNPSGGFTYKFDGENTGLDTLLNLQGYYFSVGISYSVKFYPNGLYWIEPDINPIKSFDENSVEWGRYILCGDTIKGQIVRDEGLLGGIFTAQSLYIVTSKNEIPTLVKEPNVIYDFQPLDHELDWRNCWLLKKKWFWKKGAFPKK